MVTIITGLTGRLGKYLVREFPAALAPTHQRLDITNKEAVSVFFEDNPPDIIIHSAAWVDVRGCESNHEKAWKVNVEGTENLVDAALATGRSCYFVYPSTACVFDGERGGYAEEDIPHPKNMYGLTKIVAEQIVKRIPRHLIVRTDFVDRAKWRYEGAYVDRYSTSVFADTVAAALKEVVDKRVTGIIHLTGRLRISHYDLARITTPDVKPIRLSDESLPMPRDQSLKSSRGWNTLELR